MTSNHEILGSNPSASSIFVLFCLSTFSGCVGYMRMWKRVGRRMYLRYEVQNTDLLYARTALTGTQVHYSVLFVEQLCLLSDLASDIAFHFIMS